MVGFTAVYREGFETALFYQALWSFGAGLGVWVLAGLFAGLVALTVVAFVMFRLGRKVPVQAVHEHRRRLRDDHVGRRSSATRSTRCRPAT